MKKLQSADLLNCSEFIAKAMNKEQCDRDASVMISEVDQKRVLQGQLLFIQVFKSSCCFILLILSSFSFLYSEPSQQFPVLYKGRFRPAEAYARLWLYEFSHRQSIKKEDLQDFHIDNPSALAFLWSLEISGSSRYESSPLFWIGSASLKKREGLPLTRDRFSFLEIKDIQDESIKAPLTDFEKLLHRSDLEEKFHSRLQQLQKTQIDPRKIAAILENEFPIQQRLRSAGDLFRALPSRYPAGDWIPLHALTLQTYNPSINALEPIGNFTLYSDEHFKKIQQSYPLQKEVSFSLLEAYQTIAGKIAKEAHEKTLSYPTLLQLKVESIYSYYPWIMALLILYGIALFLLIASLLQPTLKKASMGIFSLAILFHTAILAIRCYILMRPPVSNMFETVIYVPWVAGILCLAHPMFRKNPWTPIAASIGSIVLLLILEITDLNQSLEQVQAVLDSQFWLTIHVLLVVGSYGIFILGAILGHLYIVSDWMGKEKKIFTPLILQALYGGTALLITGTILGGMWAAQSWGRFWDWDPKESWAFISSCIYLIWIHAYRFHRIGSFGLAFGSITGVMAISFTWYGVNYILGTGLHSYGFGSGGERYYYAYLIGETLFLLAASLVHIKKKSLTTRKS